MRQRRHCRMNERGIRGNMITRSGLPEGKNEASNLVGFEKAISQTYAPMAIDSPRDAPDHEWEVNRQPLGLISVSVVAYQGPVHGQISAAAMDQGERKIVLMSVERGAVELEQRGRLSRCDPGMMMLMDVAHPLDVRQHTSTVILSATIPTAFLRAQCGEIEQHCCVSVPAAVGTASVLRDMLKSMLREHQRIDPNAARVLSSSFSTLVSSVFREPGEAKREQRVVGSSCRRIEAFVEQELHNPGLTPRLIAGSLGISLSYLYLIARKSGISIEQLILERRLDRCRAVLANPACSHHSITEVAMLVGFKELSHLSRRFSERFGMSPTAFRRGVGDPAERVQGGLL